MAKETVHTSDHTDSSCEPQQVYVLEGNPDEVFNEQGERLELTPEQKAAIEKQI